MINTSTLTKDIFYVGVTVKDGEPVDSDKLLSFNDTDPKTGLSLANLTIGIGTYSASCLFFNKTADRWVGRSCIVSCIVPKRDNLVAKWSKVYAYTSQCLSPPWFESHLQQTLV